MDLPSLGLTEDTLKEEPLFLGQSSLEETSQLLDSLMAEGEMRLLKRDSSGLDFFQRAVDLSPLDSEVYLRQAFALYEYASEEGREKALHLANKKLKMTTQLMTPSFAVWNLWGNVLAALGKYTREHHYFLEAKDKYTHAISLSKGQEASTLSELFWDYAVCWKEIADHSEEPLDFQCALDAFTETSSYSDQLPAEFWNDFGDTCLSLAWRIRDIRLYVKAINCFKHSITTALSNYEGWVSLAKALKMLYTYTHDEDHFSQASECFAAAAKLHPQDKTLWLNWASFLCDAGRRHKDVKRLRAAIEKCHRAFACNPLCPLTLSVWARALALIGEYSERLDILYEAQNKIIEALQLSSKHPEVWFSYGICFTSFARYFNDTDFYYQAIEKFQSGLSIDRTYHSHWHAIAKAYAMIGELEEDSESLERACRFYAKAIDLHSSSVYIHDYALALSKLGDLTHEQTWLEESIAQFERALNMQKNAIYLHPEWLFHYAATLDLIGDFYEEESYYARAIEIFSHVLMIDPDFPQIHYRLALAFGHLGELLNDVEHFYRSIHHYRLAIKHDEENDQIILDWGITLISVAEYTRDSTDTDQLFREAEHKLTQSAKLGNLTAYYHLSCLYSLLGQHTKAMRFLEKADNYESLPPLEELLQDEWLEALRETVEFREFLLELEKRPNLQEER